MVSLLTFMSRAMGRQIFDDDARLQQRQGHKKGSHSEAACIALMASNRDSVKVEHFYITSSIIRKIFLSYNPYWWLITGIG